MKHNTENTEVSPSSKQDSDTPTSTPQVQRDEKGRLLPGAANLNPTGVGGFQDHPELRNNGSWSKEDTPRAKIEAMFKDMTVTDIMMAKTEFNKDTNLGAKIGDIAASGRLLNIFDITPEGDMKVNSKEFDSLMYFVYGSKSENDTTLRGDGDGVPIITGFVLPTAPADFIDENGNQKQQ